MAIVLINPNSTEAMTQSAVEAARLAAPDLTFEGWTSTLGPASIEGPEDGDRAIPPLLSLVKRASASGADAIIIACFDDTGLAEAQQLAQCPVIGIGQASYILASLYSASTAVITTVPEAVPVITANIAAQGFADKVTTVVAAGVPVLSLAHHPEVALENFTAAALDLPPDTRTVILGCSAAVSITQELQRTVAFRVLDGVSAAARLCRAFA